MAGDLGTIQPFTRQRGTVHDTVVGVLALLGGIAMAMTNTPGSSIGFGVGGLFLMTLFR
jgi:hypothetical protein